MLKKTLMKLVVTFGTIRKAVDGSLTGKMILKAKQITTATCIYNQQVMVPLFYEKMFRYVHQLPAF